MTEIPEHLLRRAQAAREKAAVETDVVNSPDPRIPAHLIERARKTIPRTSASIVQAELRELITIARQRGWIHAADWLNEVVGR